MGKVIRSEKFQRKVDNQDKVKRMRKGQLYEPRIGDPANISQSRPIKKLHRAYPMRLIVAIDGVPKKAGKFIDVNVLHHSQIRDVVAELDAIIALYLAKYPEAGTTHIWLWDFEKDEIVSRQGYRTRTGFIETIQKMLKGGTP